LSIMTFYWMPTGINYLYLYPSIMLGQLASFLSFFFALDLIQNKLSFFLKNI
jgi:hypothetical protein